MLGQEEGKRIDLFLVHHVTLGGGQVVRRLYSGMHSFSTAHRTAFVAAYASTVPHMARYGSTNVGTA
eukprot:1077149-Rhodomonas_salina.2